MSIERRYAETLHANFPSYFANFPPNREVRLGQFGSLVDGMFNPIGGPLVSNNLGIMLVLSIIAAAICWLLTRRFVPAQ